MLNPIDIRQQSFKRSMRGFDTDEVKTFLQAMAKETQELLELNATLKQKLEHSEEQVARYRETEQMLHKTLQQAEASSKSVVETARREADLILLDAENRANDMLQKAYDERARLDNELADLRHRRADILEQLKGFLQNQVENIGRYQEFSAERLKRAEPPQRISVEDKLNNPVPTPAKPEPAKAEAAGATRHAEPSRQPAPAPEPAAHSNATEAEKPTNTLLSNPKRSFFEQATQGKRTNVDDLLADL